VSTPRSLDLPDQVRPVTIRGHRGVFAALEAQPATGVCERRPALLIPGFTGSKEDFIPVLQSLASAGRRVVAVDMRGQFETAGAGDPGGYSAAALGADIAEIIRATGARHLLGHSYGGLIAREALLAEAGANGAVSRGGIGSLTLMSSGPAALDGPRASEAHAMLAVLGVHDAPSQPLPSAAALAAGVAALWQEYLEPQAVAAGVPGQIVAFLGKRMLGNDPNGLVLMARHLLSAPDRTQELARLARLAGTSMLVIYGKDDNAWSPAAQEDMAGRLGASRVCIAGAAHSPAVETPAETADALTHFWDAAEGPIA